MFLPLIELSNCAIILVKLEVRLFFLAMFPFGVLKCIVGVAGLGVGVTDPEEVCWGKLGTELALGKLRLGEAGADSTKNNK